MCTSLVHVVSGWAILSRWRCSQARTPTHSNCLSSTQLHSQDFPDELLLSSAVQEPKARPAGGDCRQPGGHHPAVCRDRTGASLSLLCQGTHQLGTINYMSLSAMTQALADMSSQADPPAAVRLTAANRLKVNCHRCWCSWSRTPASPTQTAPSRWHLRTWAWAGPDTWCLQVPISCSSACWPMLRPSADQAVACGCRVGMEGVLPGVWLSANMLLLFQARSQLWNAAVHRH